MENEQNKNQNNENKRFYDFIIFTYMGDRFTLFPCVFNILKTFGDEIGAIYISDDGFAPMDEKTIEAIKKVDTRIVYDQSGWKRNGNLIGTAHSIGYMTVCKKLMDEGVFKSSVIVKVDPDAAILKKDWLDRFYDSNYALVGSFKEMEHYPMGNCYAFKSCYVSEVLNDMCRFKPFFNCFEDYELAVRVARAAYQRGIKTECMRYMSGPQDGFILQPPEAKIWPEELLKKCRVFCNGFGIRKENKQLQGDLQDYLWRMRNGEDVKDRESKLPIFRPASNGQAPTDPTSPSKLPTYQKTPITVNPLTGELINKDTAKSDEKQ